jgi:hypothetical protein
MAETAKSQLGIAAIIASIGIPLAQLAVGYLEQHTARIQNAALERERRRLEVTKLFLDNYIGKKTDVQIATIQIMKGLDPEFFISIEEGLSETTRSDTVKASLRRATINAAKEISVDNKPLATRNQKITQILSSKEASKQGWSEWRTVDSQEQRKQMRDIEKQNEASTKAMNKRMERMSDSLQKVMEKQMRKR